MYLPYAPKEGYGSYVEMGVNPVEALCHKCGQRKKGCLYFDTSEGEYVGGTICRGCVNEIFDKGVE